MTLEQVRAAHRATPFRPFTIRMADGKTFRVPHPEFLSLAPGGRTVLVADDDGSVNSLDLLLMTEIEVGPGRLPEPEQAR
jgi:hypothetical protein